MHPLAVPMIGLVSWLVACSPAAAPPVPPGAPAPTTDTGAALPAPAIAFDGARPTNLVVISIDTLRWDRVGGAEARGTAPHLRALLESGVVATRHRSCGDWTHPSMTCALTGFDFWDLGTWPASAAEARLDDSVTTLSEILREHGFRSVLVSSNGFVAEPKFGLGQTFDEVILDRDAPVEALAPAFLAQAQALAAADEPFYLHLHLMDTHAPFTFHDGFTDAGGGKVPDEMNIEDYLAGWQGMSEDAQAPIIDGLKAYYDGEVRYVDHRIGRLVAALRDLGTLDEALLVLLSDHGEQFSEHRDLGHGNSVYSEETAAMMGFWSPDIVPRRYQGLSSHPDLVPTVLDALGLPDAGVGGTVLGMAPEATEISVHPNGLQTVVGIDRGDERLLFTLHGEVELYVDDPAELEDVAPGHPDEVAELLDLLRADVATMEALMGIEAVWPE